MDPTKPQVIGVERVDDLPVLFASMQRLRLAETLDRHFPLPPLGRQCRRPSAERLLGAFEGISLTVLEVAGGISKHVTPLSALQKRLLELWELPTDLFQRLTLHFPEPPPA